FDRVCSLKELKRKGAIEVTVRGKRICLLYNAGRPIAVDPAWLTTTYPHITTPTIHPQYDPLLIAPFSPAQRSHAFVPNAPVTPNAPGHDRELQRFVLELRGEELFVARIMPLREVLWRALRRWTAKFLRCVEASARNVRTAWLME